jgi:GGDEF domain-containing protein/EAL domain-containing protein (putative c-di-GMP-specific phosphodiesterase class I)
MRNKIEELNPDAKKRLKQLLESQNPISAGKLVLVGLDGLKQKFGASWDKYETRVHGHMVKVLSATLMPEEVFLRIDENNYIIVFHQRDQAAAQVICEKIIQDVHETFLGEPDMKSLSLESVVMSLNHEMLARIMNIKLDPANYKTIDLPEAASTGPKRSARLHRAGAAVFNTADIHYIPIWDIRRQYVYAYRTAAFMREQSRQISGYAVLGSQGKRAAIAAYDKAVVERMAVDFMPLYTNKDFVYGFLPVSCQTLATIQGATDYYRHYDKHARYLSKQIVFELNHVTPGSPRWRVFEMVSTLKQYAKGVFLVIDNTWQNLGPLMELPLLGIILDLENDRRSEARIKADIKRIAEFAHKNRLLFGVGGVHQIGLAMAAADAGARFAYGHYLVAAVEKPLPSRALTWMHGDDVSQPEEATA